MWQKHLLLDVVRLKICL